MGLWLSLLWLQTETTSHMHSPMAIINRCRFTYLVLLELDILLVVDDVATVVVATQGLLHFSVWLTHFLPSKNVPRGQEHPSTRGPRQHLAPNFWQSLAGLSQVVGKLMLARYPPVFWHGRQQGSSAEVWISLLFIYILNRVRTLLSSSNSRTFHDFSMTFYVSHDLKFNWNFLQIFKAFVF